MATVTMSSPKISPQALKALLEVTIRLGAFIAARERGEREVGGLGVKRDVADLVDDDQRDERQAAQLGLEVAVAFDVAEAGDPLRGGRELHALASEAGADRDGNRQEASMSVKSSGRWCGCVAGEGE